MSQNERGPKKFVAGKLLQGSEEFEKIMTKEAEVEKIREELRIQMAADHEAKLAAVRR